MLAEPTSDQVVWLDGEFVPWRNATMHLCDHHHGFGVFEGVRAHSARDGAAVFRLQEHTTRLFRSAHILKIAIPAQYDHECLNGVQLELLRRNRLREAYLRPFVFYGGTGALSPRSQNLSVHVAVLGLAWGDAPGAPSRDKGITLRTSTFRRPLNSLLTQAKANANYMTAMLALQEARASGADDSLLLDDDGFAAEASAANLFIVRDRVLISPPRAVALEGITRDTILVLAKEAGLVVIERRISRDEIYVADEAFLSGTAVGVTPIREVDGRCVGRSTPGVITDRLRKTYEDCIRGRSETHQSWLSWV
jgi:branched-chain amino acid aminotransferase